MTDNANEYSEWPEVKHKPQHYQHRPVISKAVIKKQAETKEPPKSKAPSVVRQNRGPAVRSPETLKHNLRGIKARAVARERRDTPHTPVSEEKESHVRETHPRFLRL